ncbi:hypothetical protein ACOZE3_24150 [Streptomyces cinereoruber]|uniref:hypothetical protein n=1 Tax=Streptomyces cinereoruber TaxID=67260 RepID=UPI003BF4971F
MTAIDLEKARKAAEAAAAKLAEAEAVETARQAEIAARRAERTQEYDAEFHRNWRKIAEQAQNGEDLATVEYDIETMGFLENAIRLSVFQGKRRIVQDHARRAESTIGIPSNQSTIPDDRYYGFNFAEMVTGIVQKEASRRVAEFADEMEAKRQAFINGE